MAISTLALLVLFLAPATTQTADWQRLPEGQLILRPFEHAPYPHPSRDKGFKTFGPEHYQDSTVGLFIPAGYEPGDRVNYIVHFHGHVNNVANVLKKYKLEQQLDDAHVNAILIVPQGPKDAADSGGGKLELDPGAFAHLITEVTAFLKSQGKIKTGVVGDITLTAHSGGYKVTAAILHQGGMEKNITDVILLDASYGNLDSFAAWCAGGNDRRLVSLFTEHLAPENAQLMKMLDDAHVKYEKLLEMDASKMAGRGFYFSPVTVKHDEVAVNYFGPLIKSCAVAH